MKITAHLDSGGKIQTELPAVHCPQCKRPFSATQSAAIAAQAFEDFLAMPIGTIHTAWLNPRIEHCLRAAGLEFVLDVVRARGSLTSIKGIKEFSAGEIEEWLERAWSDVLWMRGGESADQPHLAVLRPA
jgi:hypothetical protein